MATNDWILWGVLGVGAFFLLGPRMGRMTAAPLIGMGSATDRFGNPVGALIQASGDEDIGIAPVGPVAAPGPAPGTPIAVPDSNTPVLNQQPVLVNNGQFTNPDLSGPQLRPQTFTVQGSSTEGFSLLGPTAGLTGDTQIRVAEFVGFAEGETFVTKPDVLADYLALFN